MLCEFNPKFGTLRSELTPEGDCAHEATVLVGPRTAKFKLCPDCAQHNYFRMFRERVPIAEWKGARHGRRTGLKECAELF